MNYISIIEDKVYLIWQQEILLRNLKERGINGICVVLFNEKEPSPYAVSLSKLGNVYYYKNDSPFKSYPPSNKPYGLYKLLSSYPNYRKNILLTDSDILVLSPPVIENDGTVYGSNCHSYIGYDYMKNHLTDEQIAELGDEILPLEKIKEIEGIGAQYFIPEIDAYTCLEVAGESLRMYTLLKKYESEGSKIQVWTAEMWSWLWVLSRNYPVKIHDSLDFSWATTESKFWATKNFVHMSGVTSDEMGIFNKGRYTNNAPWDTKDHSYITKTDNCGWLYMYEVFRIKGLPILGGGNIYGFNK